MFTLGADPEFFAVKPIRGGGDENDHLHVSLIGKIGGTKDHPIPLPDVTELTNKKLSSPVESLTKAIKEHGITIQEDNVLGEVGWKPCKNKNEWEVRTNTTHEAICRYLAFQHKLHMSMRASVNMPDEQLNSPNAFVFGCEPDYNAYTGEINPRPFSDNPNLRSAGGHIHVGIETSSHKEKMELVKYLDYFVGLPLALEDPDVSRRSLYGRAGAMRFKEYGIEWRTPSNYWFVNRIPSKVYAYVTRAVQAWTDKITPVYFGSVEEALNYPDNDLLSQLNMGLLKKGKVWYA